MFSSKNMTLTKRHRGRPKGPSKPLNEEERRLRNAELERERRDVMSDAYAELRDVLGQPHTTTRAQVLAGACEYISSRSNLAFVKRQNQLLEEQIAILEAQLTDAGGDANTLNQH